jgi:hypothetical protein
LFFWIILIELQSRKTLTKKKNRNDVLKLNVVLNLQKSKLTNIVKNKSRKRNAKEQVTKFVLSLRNS